LFVFLDGQWQLTADTFSLVVSWSQQLCTLYNFSLCVCSVLCTYKLNCIIIVVARNASHLKSSLTSTSLENVTRQPQEKTNLDSQLHGSWLPIDSTRSIRVYISRRNDVRRNGGGRGSPDLMGVISLFLQARKGSKEIWVRGSSTSTKMGRMHPSCRHFVGQQGWKSKMQIHSTDIAQEQKTMRLMHCRHRLGSNGCCLGFCTTRWMW